MKVFDDFVAVKYKNKVSVSERVCDYNTPSGLFAQHYFSKALHFRQYLTIALASWNANASSGHCWAKEKEKDAVQQGRFKSDGDADAATAIKSASQQGIPKAAEMRDGERIYFEGYFYKKMDGKLFRKPANERERLKEISFQMQTQSTIGEEFKKVASLEAAIEI